MNTNIGRRRWVRYTVSARRSLDRAVGEFAAALGVPLDSWQHWIITELYGERG